MEPVYPTSAAASILARIKKGMPRKAENADDVEISLAKDCVLGAVHYVVKTGLDPIDDQVGGAPVGRVVELFGLEACGKTELCKTICRRAQEGEIYKRELGPDGVSYTLTKLDPTTYQVSILYIDNERSLEEDNTPPGWLVEQAANIEIIFKTMEEAIKGLEDEEKKTKLKQFLIVVVDTIAGTSSKEEMAQEWGKDDYARQPKQLRQGFRTMIQSINRHNVVMICTNQVSDKIGYVEYGQRGQAPIVPNPQKYESFGGKALKFWSTWRLFLFQMPAKYTLVKKAQFAAGYMIAFKAVKNRLKKPMREGRVVLLFDEAQGGFRNDFSILETLKFLKFAEDDDDGNIVFKFRKNGVPLTTFGDLGKSLEEMDAEAEEGTGKGRYKDPRCTSRAAWPKFYVEHKADFDALWKAAVAYSNATEGINGEPVKASSTDAESSGEEPEAQTPEEAEAVSVPKRRGGRNPLKSIQV
jgi:RecA/RadA recombinase